MYKYHIIHRHLTQRKNRIYDPGHESKKEDRLTLMAGVSKVLQTKELGCCDHGRRGSGGKRQ